MAGSVRVVTAVLLVWWWLAVTYTPDGMESVVSGMQVAVIEMAREAGAQDSHGIVAAVIG